MAALFYKMIPYIFFCLVLSLVNIGTGTFDSGLSEADSDTTETQPRNNTITVTQKGSGNSVAISQSGSKNKTTTTIKSSGENNYTVIASDSDTLQTNIMFLGKSNLLVTQPGPWIQSFSIKTSPFTFLRQNFSFNEFYFILNHPDKSLHIHQTSDGVRINKKKQ
ncbi:MAG: curlin repeat-containing protein [Balneolaceae bacterium]|nr:curlin repeat-containing protein [Balneolaceae bacterium]